MFHEAVVLRLLADLDFNSHVVSCFDARAATPAVWASIERGAGAGAPLRRHEQATAKRNVSG